MEVLIWLIGYTLSIILAIVIESMDKDTPKATARGWIIYMLCGIVGWPGMLLLGILFIFILKVLKK